MCTNLPFVSEILAIALKVWMCCLEVEKERILILTEARDSSWSRAVKFCCHHAVEVVHIDATGNLAIEE